MRSCKLMDITGRELKSAYEWLVEEDCGCSSWCFDVTDKQRICVCMGWHQYDDEWAVAWKIGQQSRNNIMQCDLDIDFEMPWNTEAYCAKMNATLTKEDRKVGNVWHIGDVYDTLEEVFVRDGKIQGYRNWDAFAAHVRKTAREVAKFIKEVEACESAS